MGPSSLAERITESFYAWELRGRGWGVASYPVDLEPRFRYCRFLRRDADPLTPLDDGIRPTLLSSLWDRTCSLFAASPVPPAIAHEESESDDLPIVAGDSGELVTFRVRMPSDFASGPDVALRLLGALSAAWQPVNLEILGTAGAITLQVGCRDPDREHVLASLEGYLSDASTIEDEDLVAKLWDSDSEHFTVDFGLSNEFFLPLKTFGSFRVDPYISLASGLGRTTKDEWVCLQVLFTKARNPWDRAIGHAVGRSSGDATFADAPEFVPLAKEKTQHPLLAVVLRVCAQASTQERARGLARSVIPFIAEFERPGSNELIPLDNEDYPDTTHAVAFRNRRSYRTGMLLSAAELAGLVHVPDASVRHAGLEREDKRTKAPPEEALGHHHVLGENTHKGQSALVTLESTARLQHAHILGASGTGKSTLLVQLAIQDVQAGNGIAVLDPHGDLIDDILARIPEERQHDVIVFDPADEEWPVGLNVMLARTTLERHLLASDLVSIFQRLSTSWGDTMGAVLSNAVLAVVEHERGGTLLDLRRFLVDETFRREFLRGVADEEICFFWTKSFPLIGSRSIGPILTRLDAFIRPKLIRNIVGQHQPRLDMAAVLSDGKILLAKLSQGLIGEENASLLGSLLAMRLHQLALARQQMARIERRPFFLYADEAQHFVTPSMAALLTDVRKYGLGLVLSHQNLFQIRGSPVESALLGNAYTRVVFRVGDEDAKRLADSYSFFGASDLRALAKREAIVRLGVAQHDFNMKTLLLDDVDPEVAERRRNAIVAASRASFAMARVLVAAEARAIHELAPNVPGPSGAPAPPVIEQRMLPQQVERSTPVTSPTPRRHVETSLSTQGRGGPQHKYVQHLIKRLGEERGFLASIEETVGVGQADVVLRRGELAIACEISVSTDVEHELQNIEKCLSAGFQHVVLVPLDARRRDNFEQAVQRASRPECVVVMTPEAVAEYMDGFKPEESSDATVLGYKVRVKRAQITPGDASERRAIIAKTIARSLGKTNKR